MADDADERKTKRKDDMKAPSRKISVWRTHTAPTTVIENTYQLRPPRIFKVDRATPILRALVKEMLEGKEYSKTDTRQLAKQLSQAVKARMIFLSYKRYKIVVHVTIGQMDLNPGVFAASRCLWYSEFDNYASATFQSNKLFACVVAYFLNFE